MQFKNIGYPPDSLDITEPVGILPDRSVVQHTVRFGDDAALPVACIESSGTMNDSQQSGNFSLTFRYHASKVDGVYNSMSYHLVLVGDQKK